MSVELILKSGRVVSANRGIFGVTPDGEEISEGYDGEIFTWAFKEEDYGESARPAWSAEERRELADEMIRRWNAWASKLDADS